jgi:hypothetical protein
MSGWVSGTRWACRPLLAACALCLALFALAGCGGSDSGTAAESQLRAAKQEGEEAAREKDRVDRLERQVRSLKKEAREGGAGVVVAGAEDGHAGEPAADRRLALFHTPSGNVSCRLSTEEAACSVASAAETFVFGDGGAARVESSTLLPPEAGDLAAYGSTVSAGSVSCVIPASSSPHGVVCADAASGHGFEASRVPARQRAY